MDSQQIRNSFISFFKDKGHSIIESCPLVIKNDPSLMFVNAGMNQFKDLFLGNVGPKFPRVVNSQRQQVGDTVIVASRSSIMLAERLFFEVPFL